MKKYLFKISSFVLLLFLFGCSANSIIEIPNASIISSLTEICSYNNEKSIIAKKLPTKICNMELFNVVDYTKKYLGVDFGYGVFYDLKDNKKGSGNIYLYKRNIGKTIANGLSDDVLKEIKIERRSLEKISIENPPFSKEIYQKIEFIKMIFDTYPDEYNVVYRCYILMTGYNNVFLKVIFFYPIDSDYSDSETNCFMNELVTSITLN